MKALSLTARLSLLFALSAVAVSLGLGWAMVQSVEHHFLEIDQHEMEGKLSLVRHLLAKLHGPEDLAALPRELDDALVGHQGLSLMVLAPDGVLRFATGEVRIPPGWPIDSDLARGHWMAWENDGRSFRALMANAPTGLVPAQPDIVVIALDISHHRRFLAGFRHTLTIIMALSALVMAALGWVATRAGLRPLRRVTALTADLEASRLGARLPEARVPAEIETLVIAFNAMLARLEDSFRRLSEFSADIAHELRTPVSNLMLQAQVALSERRTLDQYREILYSSLEEYERMAQMIGDMLFLAQADNGLLRPGGGTVDLAAEVLGLFEYFEPWAEERGVALAMEGRAPAVPGDRLMLRRALSNLLENAIRHTPAGEKVQVELEADTRAIRVTVENPGVQISAEHLSRLFDRFYRVDPSRRHQGEGAGLGLAIVKSIIEAHGGMIGATSNEHRTGFLITLPKAVTPAAGR